MEASVSSLEEINKANVELNEVLAHSSAQHKVEHLYPIDSRNQPDESILGHFLPFGVDQGPLETVG